MSRRATWDRTRLRRAARSILVRALCAADPACLVRSHLILDRDPASKRPILRVAGLRHPLDRGRLIVLAIGKAAVPMAQAAEAVLGHRLDDGIVVTNAPGRGLRHLRLRVAGHPVPDAAGLAAASEVEALVRELGASDLLLVLLSGGASALLPAPVPGVGLEDKAAITALLLRSGATIGELNAVRKHLSRLKGGGLALLAGPARVVCLALSDVVGDDLSTIGSGPTVPDPTTFGDALGVLTARRLTAAAPASVLSRLEAGAAGELKETPKPRAACFARVAARVMGSNRVSLSAAAGEARRLGLRPSVLTSSLEGEAREVGRALAAILRECAETGRPFRPPFCLLAGGETTVTVRGSGHGGRNQELVLATVDALAEIPAHAVVASLATDGVDGRSDAAGGIADQETARRAREIGLAPPSDFLSRNDSWSFLATLGDTIVTGPTGTNVADITLLLLGKAL